MTYKDQMNREVLLDSQPERIISLVPSQTELLHSLGLGDRVVGITKFCLYPDEWYRGKHRIGGTKDVILEKVAKLAPDLIIGNKEENKRGDIEMLEKEYPVWMSDIFNLEDSLKMIQKVGELTGTSEPAEKLISEIQEEFDDLEKWVAANVKEQLSVAYVIWNDPSYCAGSNTFIDAMLEKCGLRNFVNEERYPEINKGNKSPDLVFLSSEPFPFKQKHVQAYQERYPDAKVVLVDGEMFSWYGSRLTLAPKYFKELLKQIALN